MHLFTDLKINLSSKISNELIVAQNLKKEVSLAERIQAAQLKDEFCAEVLRDEE